MGSSGLVAALNAEKSLGGTRKTRVDEILAALDEEERDAVLTALQERDGDQFVVSGGAIANILTAHGYRISADAVQRWRKTRLTQGGR